jgi:ABC-2 type transport system ATP-binding protein
MIKVENLSKDYGPRRAIDKLSFHADQGEILGFLGPNGAGKTTTMRILAGYMPPTEGTASIAGFDVVEESLEARRRVGYLPETVPLYPDLTVFEYLKYMGQLNEIENVEERALELIESVKLEDRADTYIEKLSKGMRQRVGVAQALLHEPEVMILDEPTIGLDPAQIRGVRELIEDIGKQRTILLSTHILAEAQQICDRVLIINKGKIVAEDTPENLEARLSGAQRIQVKVATESKDLIGKLEKVKGVTSVTSTGKGQFEVLTEVGKEARPEIARAVVAAKSDLLEMRPVGMSLEDIFLELTGEEEGEEE